MRGLIPAFFVALAALLCGCAVRTINDPAVALDLGGPVAVDVESFRGDVFVQADPTRPASVRFVRQSVHGPMRKDEAIASLEEIQCSVEVTAGELGQVVTVRTGSTHAEPHFQRAHVHVTVPQCTGLTVRTRSGRVEATNVEGPIQISSSDGDVLVATLRPLRDPVRITNQDGDIDLRCRGESHGELDLRSDGGTALCKIRRGQTIIHPGTDQDTVLASFNEGQNPIVLRTIAGDIRFVVVADPLAHGPLIVE
jgi:hypothetical protein